MCPELFKKLNLETSCFRYAMAQNLRNFVKSASSLSAKGKIFLNIQASTVKKWDGRNIQRVSEHSGYIGKSSRGKRTQERTR